MFNKENQIVLPRGVLKVKAGYNPNSSSIGTVIYSFPIVYILVSTITAILIALWPEKKGNKDG